MKRHLLLIIATMSLTSLSGQVKAPIKNHVEIGTLESASSTIAEVDTCATLTLLGSGYVNRGAYMTFGRGKDVAVGEYYWGQSGMAGTLELTGSTGLRFNSGGKLTCYYTTAAQTPTFRFYCPVTVNGVAVSSDLRLKKNVQDTDGLYKKLSGLNSVSYNLMAQPPVEGDLQKASAANAVRIMDEEGPTQFGYIAQEVREIFPELVYEDENGYLSVDYIGFIPLLVDAYKSVRSELDAIKNGESSPKKIVSGIEDAQTVVNSLSQNRPNPFTSVSIIECSLEESVTNAFIGIYDLQGHQVMRLPVEGRGNTSVQVDGSSLKPGIYIYILVADGNEIATRRMILTE